MHINWKKTIIIALDLVLGTYLVFAFTRFNKPDETKLVCTKVNINIQDEMTNGFLNAKEIKKGLVFKVSSIMRAFTSLSGSPSG